MKPDMSLLGLIHQHLLQAGFSKAARDLQTQSGEKFLSPGTSLQDIYTDWINRPENSKKRKNTKANDVPSKKLRVSDPKSSSETSDDEETATASQRNLKIRPQVARKKEKKKAVKKQASKVKTLPSTLKGMNSANQPETKLEVHSNKVEPNVQKNAATLTAPIKEDSDSSDSEKESKTVKSAPSALKPVPDDSDSSETSSSDESEMEVDQNSNDVKCIPDIAAGKKSQIKGSSNGIMAHQTKDALKTDAGDTSDSDSTDIETPNAAAAQGMTPNLSSKGAKQPVTVKIPLSVLKDIPEENYSDGNQEKEKKIAEPLETSKAKTRKFSAAVKQTLAPAKAPLPLSQLANDSSEDSDSMDEEKDHKVVITPQVPPSMPKAKTSTSSKTAKQPMTLTTAKSALPTPQQADSSSGTSDSESEEEPVSKVAASMKETKVNTTGSRAAKDHVTQTLKVPLLSKEPAEDSSADSDSDSENEPEPKKVVATPQAPKAKAITSAKPAKQPVTPAPTKTPLPMQQASDDSSGDSDSEEEQDSQKVVATPQAPKAKVITSAKHAKQPVTPAPTKAPLPMQQTADDSSGDSDSEEEQDAQQVVAKVVASSKAAKQPVISAPAKAPLPVQQVADDSSEDSDSEEEQEQAQTLLTPAQASKSIAMMSSKAVKLVTRTPAKDPLPIQQPTNDSSDDSDSKSEEESEAQTAVTAPKATKAKTTISTKSTKQPLTQMAAKSPLPAHLPVSESSEESDSESEEEAEPKVVTVQQATKGKTSISSKTAKQQTTPAPLKTPLSASAHNKDSNLGHKQQEVKKVQAPSQAKKGKNSTSSKAAMKSVAPTPAKSPVQQHTDDSSDSEEEPETKIVVLPDLKKGKTSKPKAAKQALTPTPIKSPVPTQQPADDSSDISSTDSEEEPDAKKVLATPQATKGKTSISSIVAKQLVNPSSAKTPVSVVQQPEDDSSDESSTDSEQEQPEVKKVVAPPQETKGKGKTPRVSKLSITPILANTTKATKRPATKITTKALVQQPAADSLDSNTDSDVEPPAKTADAATKLTVPTSKPAIQPLKAPKGKIGSTFKAVAVLKPEVAVSSDSDSSDSEEEETRPQLVPPTPVGSKSTLGKLASPPLLSSTPFDTKPAHGKGGSPAKAPVVVTPSIADTSSSSEDSDSPEPHTLICTPPPVTIDKTKQKATRKSATKSATATTGTPKGKVTSPLKVAAVLQEVTSESSDTSDSDKEPSLKPEKPPAAEKLLPSQNSSAQTKPSQPSALAVTSSSSDSSDSELESSQALPKTQLTPVLSPQKPKFDRKTKTKPTAAPAKEKKKNASKSKSKPLATPVQLSMLESEEETVQALLEGRSPKKNKVKKSASKKVMGPDLTANRTLNEQNNSKNGLAAEHPQTLPPAIAATPIPQSEKKSSKKRKRLEEDGVSVKKAKLDKKAKKDKKKEKKSKLAKAEAGGLTPKNKLSKKDKNKSKSKKKKKDKDKKKEGKKPTPALTAHVEGIPVSATNEVSKPKKKPRLQRRSLQFLISWYPAKRKRGRKKKKTHGTVFRARN